MSIRKARKQRYAALVKEYRKLAKRADQRLVRLERYAQQPKYSNVTQFAYKKAMRDIRSWSGENATRFNTKPPSHISKLQAKINDIKAFLGSASSSIRPTQDNAVRNDRGEIVGGGIDLTYQKRADTLNQRYGTDVTWENVGELFESTLYRKISKKYDSKTAVRVIGQLQKNDADIKTAIKKHKPISINVDFTNASGEKKPDKILEEQVNKTLRYYKKDISSLYKSL